MLPKSFTDEDRRFIRRWRCGAAVAYGSIALALAGYIWALKSQPNVVEVARSSSGRNQSVEADRR
jgi:hypothetical protein